MYRVRRQLVIAQTIGWRDALPVGDQKEHQIMPNATFEEGSEIAVDNETLVVGTGWSEEPKGSDVFRNGSKVQLAIRAKNVARAAWEAKKYKKGEMVTEGGKTYIAIVAETDETEPHTKAADWAEVAAPTLVTTLTPEYWPAVAVENGSGTVEVKANGEVLAIGSLVAAAVHVFEVTYRANEQSP
jgi:hypothetical protein